jgi:predicted Ser/Thr protein kinase
MMAGEKLGHYEIIAPLGAGGMGEVYRARDPRLNREVAIKLLPPGGDKARFQTEARALAALNHPNIVAIFDVGENYLVTELIDGTPMKAIGVRQAVDFAAQAADGLSAAHSIGIYHRDIKPQNVLVTPEGRVKLIDFGLAKDAAHGGGAQTLTAAGTIMGTAPYMSPEQVRGQKLDARSDLFSLGAVLYEQLAAQRPFRGETVAQTMSAVLEKEPADLPESVPSGLKQIVYRCLAKDKAARFQNAGDLSFALRALGGGSITGHMHTRVAAPAAKSPRLWQGLAAAAALTAIGIAAAHFLEAPPAQLPAVRLVVESPEELANSNNAGSAISPDGRMLVFTASPGGRSVLYVRPLDSLEARALAGTEGAGLFSQPFDPASATLSGEPSLLAQSVSVISANAFTDVSPRPLPAGLRMDGLFCFRCGTKNRSSISGRFRQRVTANRFRWCKAGSTKPAAKSLRTPRGWLFLPTKPASLSCMCRGIRKRRGSGWYQSAEQVPASGATTARRSSVGATARCGR